MRQNPRITQKQLVLFLPNLSLGGLKYHILRLKSLGLLRRCGGDRGGYWVIDDSCIV